MTCECLRQTCPSNRWSEIVHFLKLEQAHRKTQGFHDEDVENVGVDAGMRLRSQICSKAELFALVKNSPSERWRVLKLPSAGSLAGAQTKKAFRVAPMFVTGGKPNMQHAEFMEDLRDGGLEPWQPVVAHWPDGFSGAVPGVSVLRWQMRQQRQTGPRCSRRPTWRC